MCIRDRIRPTILSSLFSANIQAMFKSVRRRFSSSYIERYNVLFLKSAKIMPASSCFK